MAAPVNKGVFTKGVCNNMSILNVEHLSHGFGDRAIFQDVSFRLLKGCLLYTSRNAHPSLGEYLNDSGFLAELYDLSLIHI